MAIKSLPKIDRSWSLFLDRDGVINEEKYNDYIRYWDEFKFYEGVEEAMEIFARRFGRIIIVTNQRGVAKGLHRLEDVELIHKKLKEKIVKAGGRIDQIYFETSLDDDHPNRKPQPGMGHLAREEFPDINFSKSLMVGNTLSDMLFGRNLGVAANILIFTRSEVDQQNASIDFKFPSLIEFARRLELS